MTEIPRRGTTLSKRPAPQQPATGRLQSAKSTAGGRQAAPARGGARAMFGYRQRTPEQVKARQDQSPNTYAKIFAVDHVPSFNPEDGPNRVRYIPAMWPEASHYGFDVWIHYSIGPNKERFLCTKNMLGEPCAICDVSAEEYSQPEESRDKELLKALRPTKRVAAWMINRKKQEDGPVLWLMPRTFDEDVAKICYDEDSGELLLVEDPEDGYDITFTRAGKGMNTSYDGVAIARRSSPLSEDPADLERWSEFCKKNQIPELFLFPNYDDVIATLTGQSPGHAEQAGQETYYQEEEVVQEEVVEEVEGEEGVVYEEEPEVAQSEPEPARPVSQTNIKDRLKNLNRGGPVRR